MSDIHVYTTSNPEDVITATDINPYSVLSIPAYWRGVNFLSNNLTSFTRNVHFGNERVEHPLTRCLQRKPNSYQTPWNFFNTLNFNRIHYQNGYARIVRAGASLSLHLLKPCDVMPIRITHDDGEIEQLYMVADRKKRTTALLHSFEVIHLMGLSEDGIAGMESHSLHETTFQRAHTLIKYLTRFLLSGSFIKGSVEIPYDATTTQLQQVREEVRKFRGPNQVDDVLLLPGGAKLNNNTLDPEKSQLSEQQSDVNKQIAQLLGLHPYYLFDDKDGKYNNSPEAAGIDVVRYTFRPLIEEFEDEFTAKLLTEAEQEQGYRVKLNPDVLLRGDTSAVNNSAITTVNAGLRTRNEGRELLGLTADPDPESDKLKTLGDTTPQANRAPSDAPDAPIVAPKAENLPGSQPDAAKASDAAFAALRPVMAAAIERVEAKADKAFASYAGKPDGDRIIWANVFAEQQARYLSESLGPVSESLVQLGGDPLPLPTLASTYASRIRRKASTGEDTGLIHLLFGETNGQ